MPALREFELRAIHLLAAGALTPQQFSLVASLPEAVRYEYTGSGYFLTVAHPSLPRHRMTLSSPAVVGQAVDIVCGFVVCLGDGELTLECHTWGAVLVPHNFREMDVILSTPPINAADLAKVIT
jgi:hypothetical protein